MQPDIVLNPLAIGAATLACFALGSLWYGPLFGKAWARLAGFAEGWKPSGAQMARSLLLNLLGTLVMAFVLAHDVGVWRPSAWRLGPDGPSAVYGFFAGFFVWLGYVAPILLQGVAYEGKPWRLFGINAGYQFVALQAMAMILAFWR